MATYSVSNSKHATLTADAADTVTITGTASNIRVVNHGGESAAPIYFTYGDNPTAATVAGNNTVVVLPADETVVKYDGSNGKVSLICSAAMTYSVEAKD